MAAGLAARGEALYLCTSKPARDKLKAADALVGSPDAIAPTLDALRTDGDQRSV